MRKASLKRETRETLVQVELDLDGRGKTCITTGVGFFDHMLTLFGRHGLFDLVVKAEGDLFIDSHHTVEDCGIVLGMAIKEALGSKEGINRYGNAFVPMDEVLAQVTLDTGGRSYLVFNADLPQTSIGNFELELVEAFFQAIAANAELTLHINLMYGKNSHHMAEAIFKAFGRALSEAAAISGRIDGVMSTKGVM